MSSPTPPADQFSSWKEIANHLGVSVRTAQLWERDRALPVRRLPGGGGRVTAFAADLEEWRRSSRAEEAKPDSRRGSRRWQLLSVAVLVAVLGLAALLRLKAWPSNPVSIRSEKHSITVFDADGKQVWRKSFSDPIAEGQAERISWFGDLDGDGQIEIVVGMFPYQHGSGPDFLVCYAANGRELWRWVPGKPVETAKEKFLPPFGIRRISVVSFRPTEPKRIIVTGSHHLWWTNQVAVLSEKGQLIREYWHSGHLPEILVEDLDKDGTKEIYLGGVNRGRQAATVVKLDPYNFGGASDEGGSEAHQLLGFPPGNEMQRVFFPRSCINQRTERFNQVIDVLALPDGIQVGVHEKLSETFPPGIMYTLDRNLKLRKVELTTRFRSLHSELFAFRHLDHALTEVEEMAFREVKYWK